jgi:predicted nucleic acid-binding protein
VTSYVLDASVAAKWCLPPTEEPFVAQAVQLLESYGRRQIDFLVPDFFWAEVGNALWKSVRRGKISRPLAVSSLKSVQDLEITTFPCADLLPQAFDIALAHDRTVYDSVYVALAVRSESELITADEHLANALAAYLPVKWLGSF